MTHFKTLHGDSSRTTGHSTPDWIGVVRRSRGCGPDDIGPMRYPLRIDDDRPGQPCRQSCRGSRSHLGDSTADARGWAAAQ